MEDSKWRQFHTWSRWKSKSDDSFTLGTLRTDTRAHAHTNATATMEHERPKRGPLEVELKSNELTASDPILSLFISWVGIVAK